VKPLVRPASPNFSSGPCAKFPGWDINRLSTDLLGRSHRSPSGKARLSSAIKRSGKLLGVPDDWTIGIVPGSGTGAIEFALWNLLGSRNVDVMISDGFSSYWANDITQIVGEEHTFLHQGCGQSFPDTSLVDDSNDLVLVYNGTGNGVCVKSLDWIKPGRAGLVIVDAASAAFSMQFDFSKLDVLTWSWQKSLGSEAGHGMIAFSPKARARAGTKIGTPPTPKLLNFCKADGTILNNLFEGHTISTPSMLALEDLHSALDWADEMGGREGLIKRVNDNYKVMSDWVAKTAWIEWLANQDSRSPVSHCLRLQHAGETQLVDSASRDIIELLRREGVAYDIFTMHNAPAGFRVWAGPTIETDDLRHLTRWLEWAYDMVTQYTTPFPIPEYEPDLDMVLHQSARLTHRPSLRERSFDRT